MSYYDFTQLNESLKGLNTPPQLLYLGELIALKQSLQPLLAAVPGNYARAYGQVQLIKYDAEGNPTDVTPTESLTVPDSVIASARAKQADIAARIDRLIDKITKYSPATPIVISYTAGTVKSLSHKTIVTMGTAGNKLCFARGDVSACYVSAKVNDKDGFLFLSMSSGNKLRSYFATSDEGEEGFVILPFDANVDTSGFRPAIVVARGAIGSTNVMDSAKKGRLDWLNNANASLMFEDNNLGYCLLTDQSYPQNPEVDPVFSLFTKTTPSLQSFKVAWRTSGPQISLGSASLTGSRFGSVQLSLSTGYTQSVEIAVNKVLENLGAQPDNPTW